MKEMSIWKKIKKDTAVLALLVRTSIYKVIGLVFLMSAVQVVIFGRVVRGQISQRGYADDLESLLDRCGISICFLITFCLICLVMAWADSDRGGSRGSYLLGRLAMGRTKLFFMRTLYHVCALIVLFALELALVLGMYRWYVEVQNPDYLSSQALFLAFYRSPFLHSLMPLEAVSRWIRSGLAVLAGAMAVALWNGTPGGAKRRLILILWLLFTGLTFCAQVGSTWSDGWCIAAHSFCILIIGAEALGFWGRELYDK